MSLITWAFEADVDGDGDYDDLSAYVIAPGGGIRFSRGLGIDGVYRTSRLSVDLDNTDGRFTREYPTSPYWGYLEPGIPVRFRATHGNVYTRWTGYLRKQTQQWGAGKVAMVQWECEDISGWLAETGPLAVALSTARDTDAAFTAWLTAAGLTASGWVAPDGQQALPVHFGAYQDALTGLGEAVRSELGGAWWPDAFGRPRFEPRNRRLGTSRFDQEIFDLIDTVSYWDLGELSGNFADRVGSNTMTSAGGVTYSVASPMANDPHTAITLDGTDDQGSNAAPTGLALQAAVSVVAMMKTSDAASIIFDAGSGAYQLLVAADLLIFRCRKSATAYDADSDANITDNAWHFVVGVYDGANVKLYVDGTLQATAPALTGNLDAASGTAYIGRDATPTQRYAGSLARLAVVGRALTATEVTQLYRAYSETWIWGDDGDIGYPSSIDYIVDQTEVINEVRARTAIYAQSDRVLDVLVIGRSFQRDDAIAIGPGETYSRRYQFPGGITASIEAAEAVTDYLANSAQDGTGTDKTAQAGVTYTAAGPNAVDIDILNSDAAIIYVGRLKVRGTPVDLDGERVEYSYSLPITGMPATRGFTADVPWVGDDDIVADYAVNLLRTYRYPWPLLRLNWHGGSPSADTARKDALLDLEIGDLIKWKDVALGATGPYVNDWFYVGAMSEVVPPGLIGADYSCIVELHPSWIYRDCGRVVWDSFDREDSAGDLGMSGSGDTWAGDAGLDIVSGVAVANVGTLQVPNLDLGARAWDQRVEASFGNILAASGAAQFGVNLRFADADNTIWVFVDLAVPKIEYGYSVGGSYVTGDSVAFDPVDSIELAGMVQNNRVRVFLNRRLILDGELAAGAAPLRRNTKMSLYTFDCDGTVQIDNVYGSAM